MIKERARGRRLIVLLAVLALIAAACGGGGDEESSSNGTEGGGGGEGGGDVSGSATILSAFTEPADVAGVEAMIAAFQEQFPEASITHEGSPSFEEQALTRVEGGSPPEMMFIPQPGLMKDFFDRGAALPLDFVDTSSIEEEYVPGTMLAGTIGDQIVGLPARLTIKSLVWYPLPAFTDAGYEVPQTWQDMLDLTEQIKSDMGGQGTAPWCVGIESGTATGWVLTDWVEDVVLRQHGPDIYDQWVGHETVFDSPEITSAFEQVGEIWFTEGNVLGGRPNIVQTSFQAAAGPMFEDPPACMLHRQASFAPQLFPEDLEYGTDYDFFYLPPIEDGGTGDNPMLTAGDLLVAFDDSPVVQEFIKFAGTVEAQEAWAAEGNYLCPNSGCDPGIYPSDALTKQGELLAEASSARFDASDLMPAQVGTGAFWSEGTSWVAGEKELQPALQAIDQTWPEGACGVGGIGPNCEAAASSSGGESEGGASESAS
ncbi:MAG: extracellular solute-binding protein [Actinobacteria bacterium]|nr:extracellular solute-binding protein [Actinomycetota bacterium]